MRDMADPWLSIIGLGEDGLAGLSGASRAALDTADVVFGGPRHLALAQVDARGKEWPQPFDVAPVLALRGRRVAVLASADPFWFGAGANLSTRLAREEWVAYTAPSTFALAAARLGWRLEEVACHGLHATPFAKVRLSLHRAARMICLLRDGPAVGEFARWLDKEGFGASAIWVLESLGGPRECVRCTTAAGFDLLDVAAPVAVAIEVAGGTGLPRSPGLPDSAFAHDGQITKSPLRALTLAALAPRPGEHLWDIGAGSGSVSVEWCLAGGCATAIEQQAGRAANIRTNVQSFGLPAALTVVEGMAPQALADLAAPQAIFVGGGFNLAMFTALQSLAPSTCRLVVNAVTLETESALALLQLQYGGDMLRIELSHAAPLGLMRGWVPARPVVQWSITL